MNKSTEPLETPPDNNMVKSQSSVKKYYLTFSIVLCLAGIGSLTATAAILRSRDAEFNCQKKQTTKSFKKGLCEKHNIELERLLTKVKTTYMKLYPDITVTYDGDTPQYSAAPQAYRYKSETARKLLKELSKFESDVKKGYVTITNEEKHSLELFKYFLLNTYGRPYENIYEVGDWLMGPNIFCWQASCYLTSDLNVALKRFQPKTTGDVENIIEFLRMFGVAYHQHMTNLKYGVSVGIVPSKQACQAGINVFKLRHYSVTKRGKQGIIDLVGNILGVWINQKEQDKWLNEHNATVLASLVSNLVDYVGAPLHQLIRYFEDEYILHCPPSDISSGLATLPLPYVYNNSIPDKTRPTNGTLPGGEKYIGKNGYKRLLSFFTTYNITPEEIDDLANERLDIFLPKIIEIARNVTGEENDTKAIREFRNYIESDAFYYTIHNETKQADMHMKCHDLKTAEKHCPERLEAMKKWLISTKAIVQRLRSRVPLAFHLSGQKRVTPMCPLNVWFNFNPSSSYYSYSEGTVLECDHLSEIKVPFFLDKPGPKYEELSVVAHESYPGHHLEVQGVKELFKFKCHKLGNWIFPKCFLGAFTEGWATYIERTVVGEDMGMYTDDIMSKYGMYKHQILSALRAKVDVGLHYFGMKRTDAIELYEKYAWDSGDSIQKEVTRLQSAPGQGTSYMVGEAKISELREKTVSQLKNLDIRDFHYEILGRGPLPMPLLAAQIDKYIKKKLET